MLVILGLLVGGILAGQSLIRAAELRSVTSQYQQYVTATYAFRDKYFGLPGDLRNAQDFWGVAHATPATCVTTASTDSKTCNGNGNGFIDVSAGANEIFRFWQHLSNAGLIEGTYNGISIGANQSGSTKANVPTGKMTSTLWYVQYMGEQSGNTVWFDGSYGNVFEFGRAFPDYDPATPALKPEEAWNIDTKIDDGKPAQGSVVVRTQNGFNTCTTGTTAAALSADYLLTAQTMQCGLFFRRLF